ncbi:hypothetical protein Taro_023620 [Colocasia esculenta]|uniref:adenylate dimethylallyltransferase (ADP/ATP-dependent) n=1 Tax=Colocasia esculenta TaxID=4460 RepID=A0A843V4N0_COLES|nr:hypothetical protein [Colocasia esculenta]
MVIYAALKQACPAAVMAPTTTTKQLPPITTITFPDGGGWHMSMDSFSLHATAPRGNVVLVMGATGTGKSRLSLDLATNFPAEVINSDKMQVYKGLDVVTNKITDEERAGVPHHLLAVADPDADFSASEFRRQTTHIVERLHERDRLPIIAGGSNSYIEALVDGDNKRFQSRYNCCFLWVDVALPVLNTFVSERVDRMVEAGLVEEVRGMFRPDGDYSRGIRRAIGVPEMDAYFRAEAWGADRSTRAGLLQAAIDDIKANTRKLAYRQRQKILRLALSGWDVHRFDATEAFRRRGREAEEAWERVVAGPSVEIVRSFLYGSGQARDRDLVDVVNHLSGCSGGGSNGSAKCRCVAVEGAGGPAKATASTAPSAMATTVAVAGASC